MSIRLPDLPRVFPEPWPQEIFLATAGGVDAIDCVTDRMAAAGIVRRRTDRGRFDARHKAAAKAEAWRQKAGGV